MVRSCNSCSKTNRSFSSITLLVFHGMRLFYTQLTKFCSVRDAPGPFCQGCARSVPQARCSLPPGFSQVLILKVVKVLCFDTLSQVLILKVVSLGKSGRSCLPCPLCLRSKSQRHKLAPTAVTAALAGRPTVGESESAQRGTVLGAIGGHGNLQKESLHSGFFGESRGSEAHF